MPWQPPPGRSGVQLQGWLRLDGLMRPSITALFRASDADNCSKSRQSGARDIKEGCPAVSM
jgi:hypothetical protein